MFELFICQNDKGSRFDSATGFDLLPLNPVQNELEHVKRG